MFNVNPTIKTISHCNFILIMQEFKIFTTFLCSKTNCSWDLDIKLKKQKNDKQNLINKWIETCIVLVTYQLLSRVQFLGPWHCSSISLNADTNLIMNSRYDQSLIVNYS